MGALAAVLHWLGYGLCHQLPERSFFGGGLQVPVCARDTGIYIGVLVSIAVISILHRGRRPTGFPTPAGWVAVAVMVGLMAIDGGTEYAGLRPTTNELRLITGVMTGFAIGAVATPMLNQELWRTASVERVLDNAPKLLVWLSFVPLTYATIYWGLPWLGIGYPVLVALAIVGTLMAVNLVLVCMLPSFERQFDRLWQTWPALAAAFAVSMIEIWLAGLARAALVAMATRLLT